MTFDELAEKVETTHGYIEVLAKALADQQLLSIRLMAHQQAHLAQIRHLLTEQGQDRAMLNQRLEAAYQTAKNVYHDQLQAYRQSGDVKQFLASLVFPDEVQGN